MAFETPVDVLRSGDADRPSPPGGPPEDDADTIMTIAPSNVVQESPAKTSWNRSIDDSQLPVMQRSIDGLRDLFLGRHSTQQDGLRSTMGETTVHRSDAKTAAISNGPTSVVDEHGVRYCHRQKPFEHQLGSAIEGACNARAGGTLGGRGEVYPESEGLLQA